jgi:hypothetical protein
MDPGFEPLSLSLLMIFGAIVLMALLLAAGLYIFKRRFRPVLDQTRSGTGRTTPDDRTVAAPHSTRSGDDTGVRSGR